MLGLVRMTHHQWVAVLHLVLFVPFWFAVGYLLRDRIGRWHSMVDAGRPDDE